MTTVTKQLGFLLDLAKVQSMITRKFDARLGGLGYSDFMILYQLSMAPDQKLKRIDLAEKIGLTASGVTRLLLPMEKIGLVSREINKDDARVSFVLLAPGGKAKLEEALERGELLAQGLIPASKEEKFEELSSILHDIGGALVWN